MSTWCSKHIEAWNKLIIKFSASSWLITKISILRCTVSKTLKIDDACGSTTAPNCGKTQRTILFESCLFSVYLYVSVHGLLTASHRIISCVGYGLHIIDRHPPCTTPQPANCMFQNQNVLFVASNSRTSTRHGQPLREDKLRRGAGCNTVSFSRERVKVSQHKEITQYLWENSNHNNVTIKLSFS